MKRILHEMGERSLGYGTGGMPSSFKTSEVSNYKFIDSSLIFSSKAQQPQY